MQCINEKKCNTNQIQTLAIIIISEVLIVLPCFSFQSDSYKKLKKMQEELQNVTHYKHCMPLKYQLGAALFSEDKQWYRY